LTAELGRQRIRARITGTVQGVGFRPYLFRLANSLQLAGFVFNDVRGVLVEVEGAPAAIETFLERLKVEAPPLAIIESVRHQSVAAIGELGFRIATSSGDGDTSTPIAPDSATCSDCLAELFDSTDRRFRYPFINCTNCGPRFTIVTGAPYDRERTSMAPFKMCPLCRGEFDDPSDRRFHAQPNACPRCGPSVRLTDSSGRAVKNSARDAVEAAAASLRDGAIVAIKGLGGYHLACRADSETAVATLRARKHREDKPFALMVPDPDAGRELAELSPEEEKLLISRERPIVLARRRLGTSLAGSVAPRSSELGLMLPYTPLHHILLADAGTTLVMTSGNVSDEPIVYRDDDALRRLAGIADFFLLHDREVVTRTDDSVTRVAAGPVRASPQILRRSRGHVPASLELPLGTRPLIACGAELKSTFCLARGKKAWVSPHIGDLKNYETLSSYREGIAHFEKLFAVRPEIAAHDLHPDYLSTAYAFEREGVELIGVQHHHAHLAACLAEHGETGPAVGAIFDGSGYGTDGTVWGGEFLVGGLAEFQRAGHLWPVRLPGGDRAVREPWRMACAWLAEASGGVPEIPPTLRRFVAPEKWSAVAKLGSTGIASPVTSSIGRLFDAVAAICGVCVEANYEGQPAVELEALADKAGDDQPLTIPIVRRRREDDGTEDLLLDPREMMVAIARDAAAGVPASAVSARFHSALAAATATVCRALAETNGIGTVVLSGGVFQNRRLLEGTTALLTGSGLRVLTPNLLPPNDGGISYGQVAVAAARGAASVRRARRWVADAGGRDR